MARSYEERRLEIFTGLRDRLGCIDPEELAAALPGGFLDQAGAANRDTQGLLRQLSTVEKIIEPGRFHDETRLPKKDALNYESRVLAAMGDGKWSICPRLKATPAQPTVVMLAIRRVNCGRKCADCAGAITRPPASEADRCDLCGSRGNTMFWPLRLQMSYWLVVGDICHDCATALDFPDTGTTP